MVLLYTALLALLLGCGHALTLPGFIQASRNAGVKPRMEHVDKTTVPPLATEAAGHAVPERAAAPQAFIQQATQNSSGSPRGVADFDIRDPLPGLVGCYGFECVKRYCAFDDGAFSWGASGPPEHGRSRGVRWTKYKLHMVSQAWIPERTRQASWMHGLTVIVPDGLAANSAQAGWATLVVNMLGFQGWNAEEMAARTGAVAVSLDNVPNQLQSFPREGRYLMDEETLKAWSWVRGAKLVNHPEWPIEMPNVKAVVRAMDAVVAFSASGRVPGLPGVERFVVTGQSKRAIATYMAGALDPRVKAIIPMTMALAFDPSGTASISDLGGVKKAQAPYLLEGVYDLSSEESERLHAIIDPIEYADHLTMPKLIMQTGGDEFFEPDSTRHFWAKLPEPKSFYIFGNCGHLSYSFTPRDPHVNNALVKIPHLLHNDFLDRADTFINGLLLGKPAPVVQWDIDESTGDIAVRQLSNHTPVKVQIWSSRTADFKMRDFRGSEWSVRRLPALPGSGGRSWLASRAPEDGHWVAFYVAFEYDGPRLGGPPWKLTTEVSVVPNVRPFPEADPREPQFRRLVLVSEKKPLAHNLTA